MKILIALLSVLLVSCASRYVEPTSSTPSATLTTAHLTTTFPSWTTVTAFSNLECQATEGFGRMARVGKANDLSESPKSTAVRAGERLILSVDGFSRGDYTATGHTEYTCVNLISFTPQVGRAYTVSQQVLPGNRCISTIVENETREPVGDLARHPTPPATCAAKGM